MPYQAYNMETDPLLGKTLVKPIHSDIEMPQNDRHTTKKRTWSVALYVLALVAGAGAFMIVTSTLKRHRHHHVLTANIVSPGQDDVDQVLQTLLQRIERGRKRARYCQAPVPSRDTYRTPSAFAPTEPATIERLLVISRHGDRSPQNVLRDDADPRNNVTWECSATSYMFLGDASVVAGSDSNKSPAVVAKRVARIPTGDSWRPHMWRGSCAPAELTAKGRHMMVDFGRHLREIYVDMLDLLPTSHDSTALRVRATDASRTLMSAHALVEGLYPHGTVNTEDGAHADAHASKSATVSIHVLPLEVDPIHSNKLDVSCPALQREQSKLRDDLIWQAFLQHSLPTRALVEAVAPPRAPKSGSDDLVMQALNSGSAVLPWSVAEAAGKKGVPSVTENLACRECWNKTQPCAPIDQIYRRVAQYAKTEGWSTTDVDSAMSALHSRRAASFKDNELFCLDPQTVHRAHLFKSFDFFYRNNYFANRQVDGDSIVPYELGPLLREWHAALTAPDHDAHRAHLYLAHDGTLSGLLGALRAAPEHHAWPAYRSNLVVEVWRLDGTGERRVRVLHDGAPLATEGPGALPLGDGSLSLDRFISDLLLGRSLEQWETACHVED